MPKDDYDIHVKRMEDVIERALMRGEDGMGYMCNRGPRPSGALLVTAVLPGSSRGERKNIYGDVVPTEGSDSCLDAGCEIEWHAADDEEFGSPHCVRNIHAEVDALLAAARFGVETFDATIYSINKPCYNCAKAIVKAGVKTIVYAWAAYDEERTNTLLENAGVKVKRIELDEPDWENV